MKDFDTAMADFLAHLTEKKEADRLERFPSLPKTEYYTMNGKVNIRVVSQDENGHNRYVFCFVRKSDGAVLKAASWKAPAKHARGTIFTDDPKDYGVGVYGANYLR